MNETQLNRIIDEYPPFVPFTPDAIISRFEETYGEIDNYRKALYFVSHQLELYARRGLVEMRDDLTYVNPGVLMRPTKNQRIAQALDELEADGVRTMYASTISRTCGYARDDVVNFVKNGDRERFRNCVPRIGGKSEVWFLRNVGKRKNDPRRANLSGKLRTADEMANVMISALREEFDIPSEAALAELKIKMLPTLTTLMDQ